ncbi:hypothetical protein HYE67_007726 [Fusarium culmorum]|uniref:Uncharacterized protein n=1 Tax=Fusarium culmorum TaxID=5516 RepID=A0A2T4H120_FUSCU|nr:hypothetical protein FCULG_00008830 [Fusarium culmorum]QPC65495.1 hypothetical protein HYE67_007726 [Fusarium culmorum]
MRNKLNAGNKTTHDSNSAKLETITQPRFLFFYYAHPNLPHDRQERMTLHPDTKWEPTYAQTPVLYAAEPRINGF